MPQYQNDDNQNGYDLANNQQYIGQDWATMEPDIRQNWEAHQPGTWDKSTGAQKGGIQTGGQDIDDTPDTRAIMEKTAVPVTGDRIDDKTGKPVS